MLQKYFKYYPLLLPFTLSFNRIDIGYFFELKLFYLFSLLILFFNFPKKVEFPKYFYLYIIILIIHSIIFIFINNIFFKDLLELNDTLRWKYKSIIVFIKLLILQIPFFIALKIISKKYHWSIIFKAYLYGIIFVSVLAILQFVVFYGFGKDIFPLGFNENGEGRSGAFNLSGFLVLRVCSIAGEPRDLGLHVTIAFLILTYFPFIFSKKYYILTKILLILTLLLTFSTTGFSLLGIIFIIKFIYNLFFSKINLLNSIFRFQTLIIITFIIVFNNYFFEALKFVFQPDKIENILTEDVDSLVSKFLNNNKIFYLTGVGSGNIYLHTYNINDDPNLSYVKDNVIQARYGYRRLIGDQGLFLFLLFFLFLLQKIYQILLKDKSNLKLSKIYFLLTLLIFFLLRDASFDFLILVYFTISVENNFYKKNIHEERGVIY